LARLFKFVIYLCVLAFIALVCYAYLAPLVYGEFQPEQTRIEIPVTLDEGN